MNEQSQQQSNEEKENLFFQPESNGEGGRPIEIAPQVNEPVKPEGEQTPEVKKPEVKKPTVAEHEAAKQPVRQPAQTTAVAKQENDLVSNVLNRINQLQDAGDLKLPANYAVGNQLKLAWLNILEVENRDGKRAVDFCTKESIANALMEMCVQGLSVTKKQCDFIMYGNKLIMSMEYHGIVALAKRYGGVEMVTSNCIYENDTFVYEIEPKTGLKRVIEHKQDFQNIDMNKIKGAYATLILSDGKTFVEVMNMNQIRQAWMQGATKGGSPAHKNFPDQMAMKTVIGRACKLFISTSDDAGLFQIEEDVDITGATSTRREQRILKIEEGEATVIK